MSWRCARGGKIRLAAASATPRELLRAGCTTGFSVKSNHSGCSAGAAHTKHTHTHTSSKKGGKQFSKYNGDEIVGFLSV